MLDTAEDYYYETLPLKPESPDWLNDLTYFLTGKDQDINQGMELVEKALIKNPDNYRFLDTKGWSLYKEGKYKEAKELLQNIWNLRMKEALYNHAAYL